MKYKELNADNPQKETQMKMKLILDDLAVESFATIDPDCHGAGTVMGNQYYFSRPPNCPPSVMTCETVNEATCVGTCPRTCDVSCGELSLCVTDCGSGNIASAEGWCP